MGGRDMEVVPEVSPYNVDENDCLVDLEDFCGYDDCGGDLDDFCDYDDCGDDPDDFFLLFAGDGDG